MATTTHNLKIKAVLDTSEIKSQLNGIRESNAVGSGVNSSLDLNNAISRLIQALDKLPSNISREQKQSGGTNFNARAFAAFAMGYGINRVGNSFADLLEAKGYSQAKTAQSALTNIGTGAVAGAAFGPAGAAFGASIGGLTAALDYWTSKLKESSQGIEEFNRKMSAAEGIQRSQAKYLDSTYARDFVKGALEKQDIDSLNAAKEYSNQKRIQAIEQMTSLNAPELLNRKKAAEDRLKWLQKNDSGNSEIEQLQTYIANLNVQIDKAQKALELAQAADQEIAAYEAAIAQIEAEKQRVAEQELKAIQKAQEEAKNRVELITSLNQAISDQIESYDRSEETENTKKLIEYGDYKEIAKEKNNKIIESGNYKAIAVEKNRQDEIADHQKEAYRGFLESAENASTPEGKEFFLQQAEQAKASWQQAQKQSDMLRSSQESLTSLITSMIKASKNDSDGPLDAGINDFSSDYKAGLGIGEVGYDVSQDKTDKIIDITTVIKDVLEEIRNEQKTQTEVTRQLKNQGLL